MVLTTVTRWGWIVLLAGCDAVFGLGNAVQVSHVQTQCALDGVFNSNRPLTLTLANPTTRGNLLVAALAFNNNGTPTPTVTLTMPPTGFGTPAHLDWEKALEVYAWADAPGDATMFQAAATAAAGPVRLCVSEYAGAAGAAVRLAPQSHNRNNPTTPEFVYGVSASPGPGDLAFVAVVEGNGSTNTVIQPAASFTVRDAIVSLTVADTPEPFGTNDTVATLDPIVAPDPWGIIAIVISAEH